MSHGKSNELIGKSGTSFEDAINQILARANKTLRGVHTIRVIDKSVAIGQDQQMEYKVRAFLQFDMTPPDQLHL
jgi:flavin-binding protein dodecin